MFLCRGELRQLELSQTREFIMDARCWQQWITKDHQDRRFWPRQYDPETSRLSIQILTREHPKNGHWVDLNRGALCISKLALADTSSLLLLMGGALLISTVLVNKQKRFGLWKTSILAALFHGLGKCSIGETKDYRNASEMDQVAKHIHLKLESPDSQGRLRLKA